MTAETSPEFTCTLLGSFRFIDQINLVRSQFESIGIKVLAPKRGNIAREINGFKILDTDLNSSPDEIERDFLVSLYNSHFAYIVDPGGYVGFNTVKEWSLAQAAEVPIIAMEPLDPALDDAPGWAETCQLTVVRKSEDIVNFLRDPISRMSRFVQYENHRLSRESIIEESIKEAMRSARIINLDINSLGPGGWEIDEQGFPQQIDIMENLRRLYDQNQQPVKIYIAGHGIVVTYSPEEGFKKEIRPEIPEYIDPPGIKTWGYIKIDD